MKRAYGNRLFISKYFELCLISCVIIFETTPEDREIAYVLEIDLICGDLCCVLLLSVSVKVDDCAYCKFVGSNSLAFFSKFSFWTLGFPRLQCNIILFCPPTCPKCNFNKGLWTTWTKEQSGPDNPAHIIFGQPGPNYRTTRTTCMNNPDPIRDSTNHKLIIYNSEAK